MVSNYQGKTKETLKKTLFLCYLLHRKSHVNLDGIEPEGL
jgi:hypothetical protein